VGEVAGDGGPEVDPPPVAMGTLGGRGGTTGWAEPDPEPELCLLCSSDRRYGPCELSEDGVRYAPGMGGSSDSPLAVRLGCRGGGENGA